MGGFFRIKIFEKDQSGFVRPIIDETGAMVIDSHMGPGDVSIFSQSEQQSILYFGLPDALKPGMFEAISFTRQAPCRIIRAIGTGAKFAGIDVNSTVTGFGTRTGRDLLTFNPVNNQTNKVDTIATGNGVTVTYTGTLTKTPIVGASYKLYTGPDLRNSAESGGIITGTDATGSLNLSTGLYSITFTGTPGTAAQFLSSIDLSAGINLSAGGKPKAIRLTIDQTQYDNVSLGSASNTSRSSIITAINTAVGYTAATAYNTLYSQFILITAKYGHTALGQIRIDAATDTVTYDSAVNLVFASSPSVLVQTVQPTNPSGAVPLAGQSINVDYIYTNNVSATLSHSFFAYSQYDDTYNQLAGSVAWDTSSANTSGQRYILTLYQVVPGKGNALIATYNYSLIREKDSFGRSLYYADVFKNNAYVKFYKNPNYSGLPVKPTNPTVQVNFTGGNAGADPQVSDFNNAWNTFQRVNKYPAKIFMDIYGGYTHTLQNIIQNYQRFSMGISMVPPGNNAQDAVLYRQSTGIDYDHLALYSNWATIVDPYNNSFAFTSQIGAVGAKWAQMADVFDGVAPAMIDENGHGGQLNTGFQVQEMEFDYTEQSGGDLEQMDNAQINPIVQDPIYGPMIVGDRTMQVSLSDTSYIGTRRCYNLILDNAERQVLRKQVIKFNDDIHQIQVKSGLEAIVDPIVDAGVLQFAEPVVDSSNNTGAVKQQRLFVADLYVQATPTSEVVVLNLVRLPQGAVVSQIKPT